MVIPGTPPLAGLYHRGRISPVLLVSPHPYAGGMEIPLIAELAWAVTRAGHATLRFDFRGVGASRGEFSEAGAAEDLARAAIHLQACFANTDFEAPAPVPLMVVTLGWSAQLMPAMIRSFPVTRWIALEPQGDAEGALVLPGALPLPPKEDGWVAWGQQVVVLLGGGA